MNRINEKATDRSDESSDEALSGATGIDDWAVREGDADSLHGRWRVIYTIAKDGGSGGSSSGSSDTGSSGSSSPA